MVELAQRVEFWIAMLFAVLMKLRASPSMTKGGAIITTIAAIAGALVFTEPATLWLGFGGESVQFAVAALVALTCEHVARLLLTMTVQDAISLWRGK